MSTEDEFAPNLIIKHKYQKIEVLQKCLKEVGIKKDEWAVKVTKRGFEIRLPKEKMLDEEQKNEIYKAFEAAEKARKERGNIEDPEQ
ncbi:hypothetical protein GGS26DRAFT_589125 [Hypomontagnella submonticulosa]|nr:hypothetical protein GGS26DRAFT_589125 [Hypomontagnella submonticulosa]